MYQTTEIQSKENSHGGNGSHKYREATILAKIVGTLRRFLTFSLLVHPPPQYNVELWSIFAVFRVNLDHTSLDQSFLPTNQHCSGGREEGRQEREDISMSVIDP